MKDFTEQISQDLAKLEASNSIEDLELKTLDQVKQHMKDNNLSEFTSTINDVEFTFDYHKPGAGDEREDFGFTFTGPVWFADSDSLPEDLLENGNLEDISDYIVTEGEWFAKHHSTR